MIKRKNNNAEDKYGNVRHYLLLNRGYKQLIDNFPAFILGIEHDGTISIFNKFAQTTTGFSENDIIGKKVHEVLGVEGFSFDTQNINLPPQGLEAVIISADNVPKYVKWYFIPILNGLNELLGWGAFGVDITHEKKRLEEIQYLASLSRRMIDAIPHSVLILDRELNIIDTNSYFVEKIGEMQILGKNIKELFPHKFLEESGILNALNNCILTEAPANILEVLLSQSPDNGRWVNVRIYPIPPISHLSDEKFPALIMFIEDVTNYVKTRDKLHATNQLLTSANQELQNPMEKLREAQLEIVKSEKMATVGQLAAGMAHEINNPVGYMLSNTTAISNYLWDLKEAINNLRSLIRSSNNLELIKNLEELEKDTDINAQLEDMKAIVEENIDGLLRIKGIIKDLSTFSLAQMGQYEWVDINKLIDVTLQMVYNPIKHKAVLKKHYGDLPRIYVDPAKLGQVFLGIITNASQAIKEGDAPNNIIEITTSYEHENKIHVSVRDTGCGISEKNLTKIFDPFFTTKQVGEGTGLGLAVSLSIMKEMGGDILVKSKEGEGSTFTIVIPSMPHHRKKKDDILVTGAKALQAPVQKKRILIVDDEERILSSLKRLLRTQFDVTTAESGKIGLDILFSDTNFDAILCDVMMPEIDGKDFYEIVKEKFPNLADRLIFLTGGTFTMRTSKFISEVTNPVLDKPVEFHILLTTIKQTIELADLRQKSQKINDD